MNVLYPKTPSLLFAFFSSSFFDSFLLAVLFSFLALAFFTYFPFLRKNTPLKELHQFCKLYLQFKHPETVLRGSAEVFSTLCICRHVCTYSQCKSFFSSCFYSILSSLSTLLRFTERFSLFLLSTKLVHSLYLFLYYIIEVINNLLINFKVLARVLPISHKWDLCFRYLFCQESTMNTMDQSFYFIPESLSNCCTKCPSSTSIIFPENQDIYIIVVPPNEWSGWYNSCTEIGLHRYLTKLNNAYMVLCSLSL